MEYKRYERKINEEVRSVTDKEIEDGLGGHNPKKGDKLIRNADNHDEEWYVSEEYFNANFKQVEDVGIKILLDDDNPLTKTYLCDTVAFNSEWCHNITKYDVEHQSFEFGNKTYIKNIQLDELVKKSEPLDCNHIFDLKLNSLDIIRMFNEGDVIEDKHCPIIPDFGDQKTEDKKPSDKFCDSLRQGVELAKELLYLKKQIDKLDKN